MKPRKLSVVIPAYNERENIIPLVAEIRQALEGWEKEIVVADDNSPDGTAELIRSHYGQDPQVRLIVRMKDRGFAKSIREGIEKSTGDVVIIMDSDFNHQPKYLPFMAAATEHYEAVVGSRFLYGGLMFPAARHLLSWAFNVFVRLATGGKITDNLYGLLAIRREVLERCDFDSVFYGYGDYCIRLLYFLQHQGVEILQFPAVNGKRRGGVGNSAFFGTLCQYTGATLRLALAGRVRHRPAY